MLIWLTTEKLNNMLVYKLHRKRKSLKCRRTITNYFLANCRVAPTHPPMNETLHKSYILGAQLGSSRHHTLDAWTMNMKRATLDMCIGLSSDFAQISFTPSIPPSIQLHVFKAGSRSSHLHHSHLPLALHGLTDPTIFTQYTAISIKLLFLSSFSVSYLQFSWHAFLNFHIPLSFLTGIDLIFKTFRWTSIFLKIISLTYFPSHNYSHMYGTERAWKFSIFFVRKKFVNICAITVCPTHLTPRRRVFGKPKLEDASMSSVEWDELQQG